ncbi:dihydrolipoamide acetyltransferase family protein [Chlamydiifrater phoenicopteri]|uniref:dihydrolipoamide acetyltransferase family protein n=1 Tax=Chlamydiifrater phoenicopteri TaxID=2681469 RepID=UPI001BCCBB5A|nr:dihydrolipoamide acetyltransferase family protein [Chlamydiifrater phoenicopteri]
MVFLFKFPKIGETSAGGIVVRWFKQEGDSVSADEPLVEVSTDKIATELPSPVSGKLVAILAKEGKEVSVSEVLAHIEELPSESKEDFNDKSIEVESNDHKLPEPKHPRFVRRKGTSAWFSPAVLSLAERSGIDLEEIKNIIGTGIDGRITRKDLEKYLLSKDQKRADICSTPVSGESRIPLSPLRRAIASSLVKASDEVPHASLVVDVDVTGMVNLIAEEKNRFLETHGVKLTVTSFIVQCLTKTLQQFPLLNGAMEGDTIIVKKSVNVGIAVNLNKEGVVIPVIRNCQERDLVSIAKTLADLSSRARANKLDLSEVQGGSVTLTNFGMTGALIGMPIIHYPEIAILGVGTIQKRVVVKEDDSLAIRKMMYITLTFDHRVIDGIYGSEFLTALKNRMESVTIS